MCQKVFKEQQAEMEAMALEDGAVVNNDIDDYDDDDGANNGL